MYRTNHRCARDGKYLCNCPFLLYSKSCIILPFLYFSQIPMKSNTWTLTYVHFQECYFLHFCLDVQNIRCKSQKFLCLSSGQWLNTRHQSNGLGLASNQVHSCRKNYQDSHQFMIYSDLLMLHSIVVSIIAIRVCLKMVDNPRSSGWASLALPQ